MSSSEKIKRKFVKALIVLMEREPLDRITVTEIVEICEVTRPTFYRHFKDKYDLVNWYFDILAQKSFRQMGVSLSLREGLITKFQLMMEERIFFTSAFSSSAQNCLIDYDYECIYQFYQEVIHKKGEDLLTPEMDFLLRMYCHGSIYMTAEWTKNKMPLTPEEITDRLIKALPPKLYELLKDL
ncbi:MAG: TetR family transcriptional regulator [Lachnospiraceae bacterium]|nr:TetR family transcriptional regulator [Lachnospiraceae bacterium]MCI8877260.1 TetR family transcriptional regulator [Lachnospiraceae bacterium]